jgi:hypothetical protein
MKWIMAAVMAVCMVAVAGNVFAATDAVMTASASVLGATNFDVKLYRSTGTSTYDWNTNYFPTMNFGNLGNAVPADKTSALTASYNYLALVTVTNNTGATYRVQYTGAPLLHTVDRTTTLSNDAWTVQGGLQYNANGTTATVYSAGVSTTLRTAGSTATYDVYTSNSAGASDTFRVYFAITGDPTKAVGAKALIPPTQKSGSYSAQVKLTLYP